MYMSRYTVCPCTVDVHDHVHEHVHQCNFPLNPSLSANAAEISGVTNNDKKNFSTFYVSFNTKATKIQGAFRNKVQYENISAEGDGGREVV
jgi:hypothetical protein